MNDDFFTVDLGIDIYETIPMEELIWTLEASAGEFKLILARCNYFKLRSRIINNLLKQTTATQITDKQTTHKQTYINIQTIKLKPTDKTLFTRIQAEVQSIRKSTVESTATVFMVLYLESVQDLEQMFSTTNQVREEFRKHFNFPLILWMTDDVLQKFTRLANDFESWGTIIEFTLTTDELLSSLQHDTDALFSTALSSDTYSIASRMGHLRRQEISLAFKDLQRRKQHIEPTLKASAEFVIGQDFYLQNNIEAGLKHYHNSLQFWQSIESEEFQETRKKKSTWLIKESQASEKSQVSELSEASKIHDRKLRKQNSRSNFYKQFRFTDEQEERKSNGIMEPQRHEGHKEMTVSEMFCVSPEEYQIKESKEETIYPDNRKPKSCQSTIENQALRKGIVLFYIGLCYFQLAEKFRNQSQLERAEYYFQLCIHTFTKAKHPHLVAKFINPLGEVLQRLEDWDSLDSLAKKSLDLQILYGNPIRVAQAYGFLAEVAVKKAMWNEAKKYAYQALHNLAKVKSYPKQHKALYLLLLAQSARNLGQVNRAIKHLHLAKTLGSQDNPYQYIRILQELQSLYSQQKQYLKAFRYKQEQRAIEQQYGFRAFIGAGKIQPRRQAKLVVEDLQHTTYTTVANSIPPTVAPEMTASGRQKDIEILLDRIIRPDFKLIIIHGYSGVGKSSLVQAGLIPTLQQTVIGFQDIIPIMIQIYSDWVGELGRVLEKTLTDKGIWRQGDLGIRGLVDSISIILEQLHQAEANNFRIVLIFDQFEEFFLSNSTTQQRKDFFEFLANCLNLIGVKVIISLREDYIHYLLECNFFPGMSIINNDILSKNTLYKLDNFSPDEAKSLIYNLTKHSNFHLENSLIDVLVKDLAIKYGEVRPIELQIAGAQLQTDNITTLAAYQKSGTKEELVKRYLIEVVEDCGVENKQVAELVLYLLTDEKGTRPPKTRADLERDLITLGFRQWGNKEKKEIITTQENRGISEISEKLYEYCLDTPDSLNLILQIFVQSGIVMLLPEKPFERYQLVHDYLASFIQKQQKPKLNQLITELHSERHQRKISEAKLNKILKRALISTIAAIFCLTIVVIININFANNAEKQNQQATVNEIQALSNYSNVLVASGQPFDALVKNLKIVDKLKAFPQIDKDTKTQVIVALQQAYYHIQEKLRLEQNQDYVNSLAFSPDGNYLARASNDKTVKIWHRSGQLIQILTGHQGVINSVSFSPDGKFLATASDDKTIKIWNRQGQVIHSLIGHHQRIYSVNFHPSGQLLATASKDNTVKIWSLDGKLLHTINYPNGVYNAVFSPDGKMLATASRDKTVKLWNIDTNGNLIDNIRGNVELE
jgi:WD domain, G-beta repeat